MAGNKLKIPIESKHINQVRLNLSIQTKLTNIAGNIQQSNENIYYLL